VGESESGFGFELVAAPVQFDEMPATLRRAPDFNEHGVAILTDIGLDPDEIMDLKVRGVVG
jgi:crotonobetainyl-CoA:carnitine CoA-transferase CaiB-like acyl-CoA transferase